MGKIDWSKAGKRLRHTPPGPDGRNPDWNWAAERWKDEVDYAAEEIGDDQVVELAWCARCGACHGFPCRNEVGATMEAPHAARRRAAGQARIERKGISDAKG